jgi:hypothetical protein
MHFLNILKLWRVLKAPAWRNFQYDIISIGKKYNGRNKQNKSTFILSSTARGWRVHIPLLSKLLSPSLPGENWEWRWARCTSTLCLAEVGDGTYASTAPKYPRHRSGNLPCHLLVVHSVLDFVYSPVFGFTPIYHPTMCHRSSSGKVLQCSRQSIVGRLSRCLC